MYTTKGVTSHFILKMLLVVIDGSYHLRGSTSVCEFGRVCEYAVEARFKRGKKNKNAAWVTTERPVENVVCVDYARDKGGQAPSHRGETELQRRKSWGRRVLHKQHSAPGLNHSGSGKGCEIRVLARHSGLLLTLCAWK